MLKRLVKLRADEYNTAISDKGARAWIFLISSGR